MTTPPLPEPIHKALGSFAQAVAFGDDLQRRIDAGAALESAIREYAAACVAAAQAERPTLERFTECEGNAVESPLERLRFFCSLAMSGQDWLDVEQFFDAVAAAQVPLTDEQIETIAGNTRPCANRDILIARAIEAAHGIGEPT